MAYFIVIGTNNDVKCVVDEVKGAHLQHNFVTSGCVLSEGDDMYYHWDVFNEKGKKTNENKDAIHLHDALTNQISQFRALLPDDAIPNVFIISSCLTEKECEMLKTVCDELDQIGGAMLSGLLVDIILVGYNLSQPENVTLRPHWRELESLRGLTERIRFHTDILYINNMDYRGAATNVDAKLLSRFICNWSKMVCSGGHDPKSTVHNRMYSIGMCEYQYDFRDLNNFFELAAEDRLLERTLHNNPSADTQQLIDSNYFKKIDLELPWIDGLCHIHSLWQDYCTTEWNSSKPISENIYSVTQQEMALAAYLNQYLQLYIVEEQREIESLREVISVKEVEQSTIENKLSDLEAIEERTEEIDLQISSLNKQIVSCKSQISSNLRKIAEHEKNIENNAFVDAEIFCKNYGTKALLTEEDELEYAQQKEGVLQLIKYVKSEDGVRVMREAVKRALDIDKLPEPYPASEVLNMGRVTEIASTPPSTALETSIANETTKNNLEQNSGCLFWFKSLFNQRHNDSEVGVIEPSTPSSISPEKIKELNDQLGNAVVAIRKADEVRAWWSQLCKLIEQYQNRQEECTLLMDGEKDLTGSYISGKEGYRVPQIRKSVSMIDMDMVRAFRDTNEYYLQNLAKFLDRWFDSSLSNRMSLLELAKHQILDPLVGRYHTLHWDGSNPFVNENLTDTDIHNIIEYDTTQSKPFIEYVNLHESNLEANLNIAFYSNNKNIPVEPNTFRNKYDVGTDSMSPVYLKDFVNSLCVVQVMDIPNHIDALKDYKPKREINISKMQTDIDADALQVVGMASTVKDKALAIYKWLCDNIAYDTTKQIHDAETCYKSRRGVCQAYCELFCHMAAAVGLSTDIIVGRTKKLDGTISTDKHAWIFVYTNGYDGILIDPTWGAGGIDGSKFVKSNNIDTWFDVSPYWMIFTHYPDEQHWTKLDIAITEDQFQKLPYSIPQKDSDGKDLLFETVSG
jgi:hypothetical protein